MTTDERTRGALALGGAVEYARSVVVKLEKRLAVARGHQAFAEAQFRAFVRGEAPPVRAGYRRAKPRRR